MAVSDNGWPLSPARSYRKVPGTSVRLEVADGPVGDVLIYVAAQFHARVEKLWLGLDEYGYAYRRNVNNPSVWSNHASATAIDLNAMRHPNGVSGTFSKAQFDEIEKILGEVNNVVSHLRGTDEMHFEIRGTLAQVQAAANKINYVAPTTTPPASTTAPPTTTAGQPTTTSAGTTSSTTTVTTTDPAEATTTALAVRPVDHQTSLVSTGVLAGLAALMVLANRREAVARSEKKLDTSRHGSGGSVPFAELMERLKNESAGIDSSTAAMPAVDSSTEMISPVGVNVVKTWVPNRKIVAAAVSGVVALVLFVLLGPDVDANTQTSVVGLVMTLIGYLVPLPEASEE